MVYHKEPCETSLTWNYFMNQLLQAQIKEAIDEHSVVVREDRTKVDFR